MKPKHSVSKSQFWRIFREELKGEGEFTSQDPKNGGQNSKGKPQLPNPGSIFKTGAQNKPFKDQMARRKIYQNAKRDRNLVN